MFSLILYSLALCALGISWFRDPARTRQALFLGCKSLLAILPGLLAMTLLVGLVLALVSQETLREIFQQGGFAGFALPALLGSLITMPAPAAFALAGSLQSIGARPAALAAFITTLTMVGVVTAPLETTYFGWRFTLLRQSLSFILALVVGSIMGVLL